MCKLLKFEQWLRRSFRLKEFTDGRMDGGQMKTDHNS